MKLHEIKPREQNGRDTFGRYKAQVRAAAIASLSILEGGAIDKVYCDFHDDFVIRRQENGVILYSFFQVKTKGKKNESWTLHGVFGINPRLKDKNQKTSSIKDSFIGKLLTHTINFPDTCEKVVFMTNVHLEDKIDDLYNSIQDDSFSNSNLKVLLNRFNECFTDGHQSYDEDKTKRLLAKLEFDSDVEYIKENKNNFEPFAREKIHEFSEIDLQHSESREILVSLLNLVEKKSVGIIYTLSEDNIDRCAGIGIDDLLNLLSISKDAYYHLLNGGDKKAIKSASVIQRALQTAGANNEEVEFCSKCKTDWDVWLRSNRNLISQLDLIEITSRIDDILKRLVNNADSFRISSLRPEIDFLVQTLKGKNLLFDLKENHLLGGFFSAFVRFKS